MKYASDRPFADPEKAARRLLEIASTVEPASPSFTPATRSSAASTASAHSRFRSASRNRLTVGLQDNQGPELVRGLFCIWLAPKKRLSAADHQL
jgi:hypothetical protein